MYIIQNSLKNIVRNKGRNILLASIIFTIIATTVVTLMISNTSGRLIEEYRSQFGTEVTLTRNLERFIELRQRGYVTRDDEVNIITPAQHMAFADSDYLQETVFINSAMVNSGSLVALGQAGGAMAGGGYVAAPSMILQGNNWEDFTNGHRTIIDGNMPKQANECVISIEFAELNGLSVGDTIRLYGMVLVENMEHTSPIIYDLVITGIYFSTEEVSRGSAGWGSLSNRQNEVLTVFETIDNSSAGVSIIARYFLRNPAYLENFEQEVRAKGLHDMFDVSTDMEIYNAIVGPIEGLRSITRIFMIIILILGAIVLMLVSSIVIRERKYEIGVLRAMGMKKAKVALGLWYEMVFITALCLIIGIGAGLLIAQPVSDSLLSQQIENAQRIQEMDGGFFSVQIGETARAIDDSPIDEMSVFLGTDTVLQITFISLLLASAAGLVAIFKITKYEPIKILRQIQ